MHMHVHIHLHKRTNWLNGLAPRLLYLKVPSALTFACWEHRPARRCEEAALLPCAGQGLLPGTVPQKRENQKDPKVLLPKERRRKGPKLLSTPYTGQHVNTVLHGDAERQSGIPLAAPSAELWWRRSAISCSAGLLHVRTCVCRATMCGHTDIPEPTLITV